MIFENVDELSFFAHKSPNPTERQITVRRKWEGTRDEDSRRGRSPWSVVWVCCLQIDGWEHTHSSVWVNSQPLFVPAPPPFPLVLFALPLWTALARPPNDLQQCVRNALNKHWQDSSWEGLLAASLTTAFRKRWNLGLEIELTHASHPSPSCQTTPHHTTPRGTN